MRVETLPVVQFRFGLLVVLLTPLRDGLVQEFQYLGITFEQRLDTVSESEGPQQVGPPDLEITTHHL